MSKNSAWNAATQIKGHCPTEMRKDNHGMPMLWDCYNVQGLGGWAVDAEGRAIAYQLTGFPVMGDKPLSAAETKWYLPSTL